MRLSEIIFQGLFGSPTPVRIELTGGVDAIRLPDGVGMGELQDLLISLLFPKHAPAGIRALYDMSPGARVAAVFAHRGREYRVLRKADPHTLRVQVKEESGYRDVVANGQQAEDFLERSLGMPPFESFWTLNLWRFDRPPEQPSGVDVDLLEPRARDLIEKYRRAVKVEAAEEAVKGVEATITGLKNELGHGAALEEKLQKAREKLAEIEIAALSTEDLELCASKDERLVDYDAQVERLAADEEAERHQVEQTMPERPWRMPPFWAGLIIGFAALAVSLWEPAELRAVALIDVLGFGVVAWIMVQYFNGLERASVHQVRLESIKRRLNQVREEQVGLQERVNHLMIHAGVRDAKELNERVSMTGRLREMIGRIEEQVDALGEDPAYRRNREELDRQMERLKQLEEQRAEMEPVSMSAYQIESDLELLGVDPAAVLAEPAAEPVAEAVEGDATAEEASALGRILEGARGCGQWDGSALHVKTRKMWSKICGHVLGERFAEVAIEAGALAVGSLSADQVAMWRRTRPSEYTVVLAGLCLAVLVNADELRKGGGLFENLIVPDLDDELTAVHARKFRTVFQSASKKCGILVPDRSDA